MVCRPYPYPAAAAALAKSYPTIKIQQNSTTTNDINSRAAILPHPRRGLPFIAPYLALKPTYMCRNLRVLVSVFVNYLLGGIDPEPDDPSEVFEPGDFPVESPLGSLFPPPAPASLLLSPNPSVSVLTSRGDIGPGVSIEEALSSPVASAGSEPPLTCAPSNQACFCFFCCKCA